MTIQQYFSSQNVFGRIAYSFFLFIIFNSASTAVGASNKVGGMYMTHRIVSAPAAKSAPPQEESSTVEEQSVPQQKTVEDGTASADASGGNQEASEDGNGQEKKENRAVYIAPVPSTSRQHKLFRAAFAMAEKSAADEVQDDKKTNKGGIINSITGSAVNAKNAVDANVKAGAVSVE